MASEPVEVEVLPKEDPPGKNLSPPVRAAMFLLALLAAAGILLYAVVTVFTKKDKGLEKLPPGTE